LRSLRSFAAIVVSLLFAGTAAQAQVNSGSNGSDGAFNPATNTQQQVIMVVHHHPGMDAPTGLLTRFAQRCQPQLAVALVGINVPPLVAARHHMVSGPGILEAYLAYHRR
jgi:hypothetical protein